MVEQVLRPKDTSQGNKRGMKSSLVLLIKAWPQLHLLLWAVYFLLPQAACRLSGPGTKVKQEGQLESYCRGKMMIL